MLTRWVGRTRRMADWVASSAASAWTTFLVLQALNRDARPVPAARPQDPFVARTGYVI